MPEAAADYPRSPDGHTYELRARARGVPAGFIGVGLETPIMLGAWLLHFLAFRKQWVVEVMDISTMKAHLVERYGSREAAISALAPLRAALEAGTWNPRDPH